MAASDSNLHYPLQKQRYPLWFVLSFILAVTISIIIFIIILGIDRFEKADLEDAEEATNKIYAALTVSSLEPVISEDVAGLETILEQIIEQVSEIQSITVKNEEGLTLTHQERQEHRSADSTRTFVKEITFAGETFGEILIVWDIGEKYSATKTKALNLWIAICLPLVLLTLILLISLHFLLLKPIAELRSRILSIRSGDYSTDTPQTGSREIQLLQSTVTNLCNSLQVEEQQRKELLEAKQRADYELSMRRKAETEKEKLLIELHKSQKLEAIGMLAGRVAHDLNNVLSGIVTYPDLLTVQMDPDSPHLKTVKAIKESGDKAAAIVQDLLTLARRGITNTSIINLNDVVINYLKSPECKKLQSLYPNISINSTFEKRLLNMKGSPVHLSKTVMNLVNNATEAMPNGGEIIISTENRYIDQPIIGFEKIVEGEYITLTIADTGIGISPKDREKIFEPFFTNKQMGRSGTGLGMAVVWGTVKDHSGYVDLHSREGEGTTFILYFPVTRKQITEKANYIAPATYKGNGEKILVVDDVELQRSIAQDILTELGYQVATVSSGEEAVKYIENNFLNLVLLDMIMEPGIDGIETYRRIKKHSPAMKAVLASGYSETDRMNVIQELGINQNIKKPYTIEKIGMAIKEELSR